MYTQKVLVSYRNETNKKKLEDYITEATNNSTDLGNIGYDGELTINTMNIDLTNISRTNITCAAAFPGVKFTEVDKFIEWHKRINRMGYIDALHNIKGPKDIIALYYDSKCNNITYVCLTMYDKSSIEKYIGSSDGKALAFTNKNKKYWCLIGNETNSFLLFRQDNIKSYTDISCSDDDISFAKYLFSII